MFSCRFSDQFQTKIHFKRLPLSPKKKKGGWIHQMYYLPHLSPCCQLLTLFSPTANKKFKRGRSSDFSWQSLFYFPICKHIFLTSLALAGLFQVWYFSEAYCMCVTIYVSICILKKRKERGKNHSVSNNEHVHLFASGLHTQFSQKARADHDLAFDISCLQARGD